MFSEKKNYQKGYESLQLIATFCTVVSKMPNRNNSKRWKYGACTLNIVRILTKGETMVKCHFFKGSH